MPYVLMRLMYMDYFSDVHYDLVFLYDWQRENVQSVIPAPAPPPPPPPPPKEPTFKCPICISPIVEETSTKCGHIFCKACIRSAIGAKGKCPTCRRKVTMKDTIRIYLPASD